MGDIGPERAHYDVLPTAADVPAPAVEVVAGQVAAPVDDRAELETATGH